MSDQAAYQDPMPAPEPAPPPPDPRQLVADALYSIATVLRHMATMQPAFTGSLPTITAIEGKASQLRDLITPPVVPTPEPEPPAEEPPPESTSPPSTEPASDPGPQPDHTEQV